jgi:PAS domain S-box-containing protein
MPNNTYNSLNILKPFVKFFNHFWWEKRGAYDSTLLVWRKRIFSTIFLCASLTGAFAYIPNIKQTIQTGQWTNAIIYTMAYLVVIAVATVPVVPFMVRAWIGLLICFYGVGLTALIALGPVGSGRMFLFAFALMTTLLLGLRSGILALVLNIFTFLFIGWMLSKGHLQWPHLTDYSSVKWTAAGFTFFFFNTVVTVSIGLLVNALEKNLLKEQSLSKQLKLTNKKLGRENLERRQAETSLRNSEERFRIVSELTSDLSYSFSVAQNNALSLEWVTGAMERITGFNSHDLSKFGGWKNLVHKDDIPLFSEQRVQLLSGEPKTVEYRILSKTGAVHWLLDYSYPVWSDEQKRVINIYGAVQDITKRKESEKALRESEEKYKTLTNNLHVGIYRNTIGSEGKFLEANPAILKIFGFENKQEFLNIRVADLYQNPENRQQLNEKMLQNGFVRNEELLLKKKNGSPIVCSVSAVAVKNEKGEVKYYDGFIEDVTEHKQLESQLQQAQKMEAIGTLAGGVAHDLNNILSGMVSYPELLLMDIPDDSPLKQPLLTIQQSGQKAAAIVQDLLTLARRGVSVREVIDLNQLIEQYLNSPEHQKILEYHPNIEVVSHLEPGLLNIVGSPVHLSKTVMNMVSNAAEAMPDNGCIRIATEACYIDRSLRGYDKFKEGDYVTLTVSDDGIGISPEDLERIFEPFYTKKAMGRSGTGLGMAVVWGTVKDHNGYIDVQSELGEGTTFTLYFPITRKKLAKEKTKISTDRIRGRGESILIVDDAREQREIASEILKKLGYNVIAVPSGEEALMYMKEHAADLLVLDMIMNPGIDGLETYKRILQLHPDQKAIIASGFSETDRVKEAQNMGAGAYVKKPYSFESIGMAVKGALAK